DALHEVHAADLRPLLHSDQLLLLASAWLSESGCHPRQGGPFFNRPRVGSIQAASTEAPAFAGASMFKTACSFPRSVRDRDVRLLAVRGRVFEVAVRVFDLP